jgi:hypothetical protein
MSHSLKFDDIVDSLHNLMMELVTDICIDGVAFALHGVVDSVVYGEKSEKEE